MIPKKEGRMVSYEKMFWEDGAIAVFGLQVKDPEAEVTIDRIELKFSGSVFHLKPKITLLHPQILLSSARKQETPSLPFLYRTRLIKPCWEIKNGVLQLPTGGRFYFSMSPGVAKESIGDLVFSSDPDPLVPPMFSASLALIEEKLQIGFTLQESDLSRLLPLASLIVQEVPRKWERAGGEVQLEGLLCFDRNFKLEELHCHGEGKQIVLTGPMMGMDLQCEEIKGFISYPTTEAGNLFGDKWSASLFVKKGSYLVNEEFGIKDLDGSLCLEPKKEPALVLNGHLVQQGREISFGCVGKGAWMHDATFWSEIELHSISSLGQAMQATVSLCSHDSGDVSLRLHVDNADSEHLNFARALSGISGCFLEGTARMTATFLYREGNGTKASLENCHLDNIRWSVPQTQATLFSKHIATDCVLEKTAGKGWSVDDLHLQCEEGDYLDAHLHLHSLSAKISIDHQVLQPSQIRGKWGSFEGEVTFLGPQADHLADLVIRGDGGEILSLLSHQELGKFPAIPLSLQMTGNIQASELHLETLIDVSGESMKSSTVFSISHWSLPELFTGNLPHFLFKEANLQAGQITEKSYGPFLPLFLPKMQLSGSLRGEAVFLPSSMQVKFTGDEILMCHPLAQLYLPHVREKNIQFSFNSAQKQWQGEIPLDEGKLTYTEHNLSFENLEGSMKIDANHLTASAFYAECEGVALRADLDLFLESHEKGQISLSTSQMAGTTQNLFSVLRHFPSLPKANFLLEGSFASGDNGFILSAPIGSSGNADWSFHGNFYSLKFPVNDATAITDGHCDLVFNSKTQGLVIDKGEGTWLLLDGTALTVQLQRCSTQLSETANVEFAFKILDGKKECAQFQGKASQTASSEWKIVFDQEKTSFGRVDLNIAQCALNEEMKLVSFEMMPILKCQDLHIQAAFLQNAGFLSKAFSAKNLQDWQFEGSLQTRLYSEAADKGFSFHAESRDLKVRGRPWISFQLKAHKIGENWLIEHLEGGGLTLKGAFIVDGSELSVQHFEGKWQGIEWQGSGNLKTDQKTFSCKLASIKGDLSTLPKWSSSTHLKGNFIADGFVSGDLSDPRNPLQLLGETNLFIDLHAPCALSGKNRKTISFTYDDVNGLVCNRIDLQFKDKTTGVYIAELKSNKLLWAPKGILSFEKLEFSLSPKWMSHCIDAKILPPLFKDLKWEGDLAGSGDLQIASGPIFQAALKPGRYGFRDKDFPFEQLHLRYEKDLLTMRGKTQLGEKPLWGMLQVNLSKEPFGALKLYDHPKSEGLKILFNTLSGTVIYESIQGSCYGLDCNLTKNKTQKIPLATLLSGNLKIDCQLLSPLLPKVIKEGLSSLKIGKGYEWQGDLILWQDSKRGFQASGTLAGEAFEFLGYQFHTLQGNLDATPERILITDLKINDPAGMMGIKKFELNKNQTWSLYIPQIFVRQWQPSLMQKIGADPQVVKPFTIKNFILSEIRGTLGDKASLKGSGKLTFVNQFKKESSFLDVPLEMIKKIGLDPHLLTPVHGELEIELHGDKFYLMSLKNSFSEGDRAEFYLAPTKELSYIDLNGKIHIDLKMHQDVMLKITEPFTLTIRGTLEKPRYGLQY
jgi:hypothetical protein